jgi:MFS family permease
MTGTIVDPDTLGELVAASLGAGIGVTLLFSVAIYGLTRFSEARRERHGAAVGVFGVVAAVALAACLGAVVLGIVAMTQKS